MLWGRTSTPPILVTFRLVTTMLYDRPGWCQQHTHTARHDRQDSERRDTQPAGSTEHSTSRHKAQQSAAHSSHTHTHTRTHARRECNVMITIQKGDSTPGRRYSAFRLSERCGGG